MYHIFFIQSLVEGHLRYVQVLAITNIAAVSIIEQMYFIMIEYPFVLCSRVVLLDFTIGWSPIFLKNQHTDLQSGSASFIPIFILCLRWKIQEFLSCCSHYIKCIRTIDKECKHLLISWYYHLFVTKHNLTLGFTEHYIVFCE